jgi:hypothetical protein
MMAKQEDNLFEFAEFDEKQSEHIAAPRYSYWKSVWRTFVRSKVTIPLSIFVIVLVAFAMIQPIRPSTIIAEKKITTNQPMGPSVMFKPPVNNKSDQHPLAGGRSP